MIGTFLKTVVALLVCLVVGDVIGVVVCVVIDVAPLRYGSAILPYAIWLVLGAFAGFVAFGFAGAWASASGNEKWVDEPRRAAHRQHRAPLQPGRGPGALRLLLLALLVARRGRRIFRSRQQAAHPHLPPRRARRDAGRALGAEAAAAKSLTWPSPAPRRASRPAWRAGWRRRSRSSCGRACPRSRPITEGRIALWLACSLIAAAWLLIAVGRLAGHRFFTPADIDGGGLTEGTPKAKLLQTLIQNTLEQCLLAIPAYGAWLWLAPEGRRGLVVLCAACFALGRLLFFAGYARGAPLRALGFTLTFYPDGRPLSVPPARGCQARLFLIIVRP